MAFKAFAVRLFSVFFYSLLLAMPPEIMELVAKTLKRQGHSS